MSILVIVLAVFLMQCETSPKRDVSAERHLASKTPVVDKSGYQYDPSDRSCDGFPRLQVETLPGTCLGLVLPRSKALDRVSGKGFVKPRTIVPIPGTDSFLVADMGGWSANNGRLFWLYRGPGGAYELKLLKFPLNLPHGLRRGPDGYFYIGEKHQISRFHIEEGRLKDWQLVVGDLPSYDGHMHPLSQFTFDPRNNDLYINSGAPSDHCYVQGARFYKTCPEEEAQGLGSLYRISAERLRSQAGGELRSYEIAASGLRNSMAMVIHPSGTLVQGENSRDFPELEEPYEEINIIDLNHRGGHYGWPYCYNFNATSPEWLFKENANAPLHARFVKPLDCDSSTEEQAGSYRAPHALMPPHVAPLHMAYYKGPTLDDLLGGKLLISWHGHQPTGNRLVAYDVDSTGRPLTEPAGEKATYHIDRPPGCPVKRAFQPRGGMPRYAPYTEVISGWYEIKGVRPKGNPVGFTVADDGSIWIVEDRDNRTIVRLARTDQESYRDHCVDQGGALDTRIQLLAWRNYMETNREIEAGFRQIESRVINKYCTGCHGDLRISDIAADRYGRLDFLMKNRWFVPNDLEKSKMYGAIARLEGYTPMPPADKPQFFGTTEGEGFIKLVADWLTRLPNDIDERYARTKITGTRNIRARPSSSSAVACGRFQPGDFVYVDPRPEAEIRNEGWIWNKVYLLPGHTRLFKDKCSYPLDGTFYVAIRKSP